MIAPCTHLPSYYLYVHKGMVDGILFFMNYGVKTSVYYLVGLFESAGYSALLV